MKTLVSLSMVVLALASTAFADAPTTKTAAVKPTPTLHRYLIERTFPKGALAGLDAETKSKVNANNSTLNVHWIQSYATADRTKTFCVYEGPNEAAVRKAAELNGLPVDSVTEVPETLLPK